MTSKPEPSDEESFIILGSSPGTSLDIKCNGMDNPSLDRAVLDDAIKDLSNDASMAFKAHFKLDSGPSPTSLMVASTMITDDKSTEELQKQFGEILDENLILKETLKKNNESMKEQFLLIASCQEDMMKTHVIHKEKFDETRELVEKLRQENKKLKLDVARLAESEPQRASCGDSQPSSGPPSLLEFVTSPDDDTINKLTAQLGLVEKQRRQVIVENEKLTWQKESLEHIVDSTSKERDDVKEKLKNMELKLSNVESDYTQRIDLCNLTINDLTTKLEVNNLSMAKVSPEELSKRDEIIQQLDAKVASLQNELKQAKLTILELGNVKLDFSRHKAGVADTVKIYKEQIQDLQNKLKDAQTTVFHPIRFSISTEPESGSSEFAPLMANVKVYDKTLKHLAQLLNMVSHGSIDSLAQCMGVVASLQDFKLERSNAELMRSSLQELRTQLDLQHQNALSNIGQVKTTLSIFEGIFKDYNELLKKSLTRTEKPTPPPANVEQLTAALVARGHEIQMLKSQLETQTSHTDIDVIRAQLDVYKSDFQAEREARQQMASEKETLLTDLRTTQRQYQELNIKYNETKAKLNERSKEKRPLAGSTEGAAGNNHIPQSTPEITTGNKVYTCPKCLRFSSDQYKVMEDHFDFCLDDF